MQTSKQLRSHKQRLKHNMTGAEKVFARRLNKAGFQFKVQMILGFYILDFCIPDRMLNIEIDGSSHDRRKGKDGYRDRFITQCGFQVIRIPNSQVHNYDLTLLHKYPTKTLQQFRSALGKANSKRGIVYLRQRQVSNLLGASVTDVA